MPDIWHDYFFVSIACQEYETWLTNIIFIFLSVIDIRVGIDYTVINE
jgi:hypothetical protein